MSATTPNDAKIEFLKALCKVQGTMEAATKDSKNPHFGNNYASLESVNSTVMGPLNENGFVLMQGGVDIGGKHYLRTTLFHVAGHSESFDYPLIEKTENPQHMASATTYARRYSICALLNLSTEDDDAETASASVRTVTRQPASAAPSTGIDTAHFVPTRVVFVDGKGKGAGKKFAAIYSSDGVKYDGDEMQGELAESARQSGKEVSFAFERKGQYLNIKKNSLKMATADENYDDTIIEEAPFR